jgi:hypothetical protein
MPTEHIVAMLRAERDKIDRALQALEADLSIKRRGRPRKNVDANVPDWVKGKTAKPKKKGRTYTAKQRKEASARMKARWAVKKEAPAKRKSAKTATAAGQ